MSLGFFFGLLVHVLVDEEDHCDDGKHRHDPKDAHDDHCEICTGQGDINFAHLIHRPRGSKEQAGNKKEHGENFGDEEFHDFGLWI